MTSDGDLRDVYREYLDCLNARRWDEAIRAQISRRTDRASRVIDAPLHRVFTALIDADSDIVAARFLEVVPDDRVVQAVDFESDDARFAGTMTMTWSVTAVGTGTRVDMRADDVPSGISAHDHADGMNSSLDNLAAFLEARR